MTDDILCSIDPERTFKGDHVEFFIDALNDQTDLPWDDDLWYAISVLRRMGSSRGTSRRLDTKAAWKLEPRLRGYVVEMAIPLEEMGIAVFDGQKMGFNVRVRDRDAQFECKTIWWRAIKEPFRIKAPKRTFGWGELQFIGAAGAEM